MVGGDVYHYICQRLKLEGERDVGLYWKDRGEYGRLYEGAEGVMEGR